MIQDVVDVVEADGGRPVRLRPYPFPPGSGLSGMSFYISDEECFEILFESRTEPLHQDIIKAHESGHLLFDDVPTITRTELESFLAGLRLLAPQPPVQVLPHKVSLAERRAEWFADAIMTAYANAAGALDQTFS